jgi:hypothetical protein
MICTNLKNANQGAATSYGKVNGYLFAGQKPAAIVESAAKLQTTWETLMQQDIDAGRLMMISRADVVEPGEPEVQTADSENGAITIDKSLATHSYDVYADDCGMRSVLKVLGSGVTVYGYQLTKGGYIRGQKNSEGNFAPIKLYMYAHELEASSDRPDAFRLIVAPRQDFKENQWSIKPDFDIDELESIKEVLVSNLVADDTADTITFNAKYCNGCAATDPTLANYIFTAGGVTITPTGIPQTGSEIVATFAAGEVTGEVTVTLAKPSVTGENYESDTYTATAA